MMKLFSYRNREPQVVEVSHYDADNSPAWWVGSGEDRVVFTVCAIDLGFDPPRPGYIYVRDWSYTEGCADALVAQGICELVTRIDINGHGSKLAIMRVLS